MALLFIFIISSDNDFDDQLRAENDHFKTIFKREFNNNAHLLQNFATHWQLLAECKHTDDVYDLFLRIFQKRCFQKSRNVLK